MLLPISGPAPKDIGTLFNKAHDTATASDETLLKTLLSFVVLAAFVTVIALYGAML